MKKNNSTSPFSDFIKVADQFKLGSLPTENCHPKTTNLSVYANSDIAKGIAVIKELDLNIFNVLLDRSNQLFELSQKIYQTFDSGKKVFLCGCGATGRLSLVLETLWLQQGHPQDQVISFMAGGDTALIKSIEDFEDHPEFGEQQLMELGFVDGDLLISCTEGGETPFVIGATEKASQVSKNKPYFLYCNPDDQLIKDVERSRNVLQNENIKKINLFVGPMALSGSTRMQASSILMLAVGIALLKPQKSTEQVTNEIIEISKIVNDTDFNFLKEFIEKESEIYCKGERIFYATDPSLGISILTDTTERSPTFSLLPFENLRDKSDQHALCYLLLPNENSSKEAWKKLLWREPRALDWPKYKDRVNLERLIGYDFSRNLIHHRSKLENHQFSCYFQDETIHFHFGNLEHSIDMKNRSVLAVHTLLKLILNIHSTLVMGRLGRYQDNMMVWVRPSNFKLIDRSIRYINHFLMKDNIDLTYEEIAKECANQMQQLSNDQSVVLNTVNVLRTKHKNLRSY